MSTYPSKPARIRPRTFLVAAALAFVAALPLSPGVPGSAGSHPVTTVSTDTDSGVAAPATLITSARSLADGNPRNGFL